ncbi:MAG: heme transporter HemC [Alphaproteobacteria bacterium]|nr:MAG: heme transporter HemC [Alphaproteobacteria bacterium]
MHRFANPTRFLGLARRIMPWSAAVMWLALLAGLYLALIASPPDYQQGETVRIMYIHVPSAMMSLGLYAFMGAASFVGLVWRHPLAHLAAKAAAPVGAAFAVVTLATGSLWGRPMWGTWWEWGDARMTSMLVQLFLYVGYIAVWQAIDNRERAARAAAVVALVGLVNLPIIKFSVEWWNTLHQGASILRIGGPSIHPSMQWPLWLMVAAAAGYATCVILWRLRAEIAKRRIEAMQINQAQSAEG